MGNLFDDLKLGLEEAIAYEKGSGPAKIAQYEIIPVKEYSNEEIRTLRMNAGMTQVIFAAFMGVSKKTVEAWERGRIHPSGTAFRLMEILDKNMNYFQQHTVRKNTV